MVQDGADRAGDGCGHRTWPGRGAVGRAGAVDRGEAGPGPWAGAGGRGRLAVGGWPGRGRLAVGGWPGRGVGRGAATALSPASRQIRLESGFPSDLTPNWCLASDRSGWNGPSRTRPATLDPILSPGRRHHRVDAPATPRGASSVPTGSERRSGAGRTPLGASSVPTGVGTYRLGTCTEVPASIGDAWRSNRRRNTYSVARWNGGGARPWRPGRPLRRPGRPLGAPQPAVRTGAPTGQRRQMTVVFSQFCMK